MLEMGKRGDARSLDGNFVAFCSCRMQLQPTQTEPWAVRSTRSSGLACSSLFSPSSGAAASSSEQRISANESLSLPHSCFSSGLSLDTNGTRLHLTFDFWAQQLPGTGSNKLRGALVLMLFLCWSCPTVQRLGRQDIYYYLTEPMVFVVCGGACGQICFYFCPSSAASTCPVWGK
jgi:hypothetical protein